jgi:probable addiction module antidote protein
MMKKKMSISVDDLPEFDAAPYLESDEAIAAYLTDILEENDSGLLAAALGEIARARGMTEMAKSAGITREALYKALRSDSAPRFDTVSRVCTALGVRLVAQAINSNAQVLKQEQEVIHKAISSKPRAKKMLTSKPKKPIKKSSVSAAAVKRKAS